MTTDSSPETKPTSTLTRLKQAIASSDPTERYWGLVGLRLLGEKAAAEAGSLLPLLKDKHAAIRTTAAQALYAMGKKDIAAKALVTDVASEMDAPSLLNLLNILRRHELLDRLPDGFIELPDPAKWPGARGKNMAQGRYIQPVSQRREN
jgi:hypothetical protein